MPGDRGFEPMRNLTFGDVKLRSHQDPQFMVVQIKNGPLSTRCVNLPQANPRRAVPLSYMVQWGTQAGTLGTPRCSRWSKSPGSRGRE